LPFLLFDLPGWFSRATLDIFQTQLATYSNFRLLNYCLLLAVFFITEVAQIVGYSYVLKVNVQHYILLTNFIVLGYSWATFSPTHLVTLYLLAISNLTETFRQVLKPANWIVQVQTPMLLF
jgi:hypothetical protein